MSNLEFQKFQDGFTINATNDQGFSGSIGDRNNLVNDSSDASVPNTKRGFFNFDFYQQYFDVDTEQVTKRLLNSAVPTHNNYILDFVQPIADLWGPFWVSVTLVFSIGIFGNIAQYVENEGREGEYGSDFRLVTSASTLIFAYVLCVPLLIFGLLWWRRSELQYPYIDLICAYGYSLTIFIPVSVLWMLDVNWFRWALIFVAVSLSGVVLAKSIWPAVKNDSNKLVAYGSIFGVLFFHFLLAFAFKEYFFDAVHPTAVVPSPLASSQVLSTSPQLPSSIATNVSDISAIKNGRSLNNSAPDDIGTTTTEKKTEQTTSNKSTNSSTTSTEKKSSEEVKKKEETDSSSSTTAEDKKDVTTPLKPSTTKTIT